MPRGTPKVLGGDPFESVGVVGVAGVLVIPFKRDGEGGEGVEVVTLKRGNEAGRLSAVLSFTASDCASPIDGYTVKTKHTISIIRSICVTPPTSWFYLSHTNCNIL